MNIYSLKKPDTCAVQNNPVSRKDLNITQSCKLFNGNDFDEKKISLYFKAKKITVIQLK